jgi:cation transport ATPase
MLRGRNAKTKTTVDNAFAIPVAAGVFCHTLGWVLAPQVSAVLMSASSIAIAVNAVSVRFARISRSSSDTCLLAAESRL